MKKSKVFLATGALILAILAVFATKVNKKFATVATGVSGNFSFFQVSGFDILTTRSGSTRLQIQLCTVNGHPFMGFTSGDLVTKNEQLPIYLN